MNAGLQPRLLALLLAGLGLPAPALAQLDALALRLSRQFEVPLRWHDADAASRVAGVVPAQDAAQHQVRLAPGQSLTLRVPSGEPVRVHAEQGRLDTRSLHFALSNGSALYVDAAPRSTADGRNLLVDTPNQGMHLLRLSRPPAATEALEFGLFIGHHAPHAEIAPYRVRVALPGESHALRRDDQPTTQPYSAFAAGRSVDFDFPVDAPTRLMLEGRMRYTATESSVDQLWRLALRADGRPIADWSIATGTESRRPIYVDGRAAVLSREHRFAFVVPAGTRRLSIESSQPALLRLLRQAAPDYLLAGLNAPRPDAVALVEQGLHLRLERQWSATLVAADEVLADAHAAPLEVARAAQRLAQDNRRREGGLQGAAALAELAAQRRDAPALAREAATAFGHFSFYRELLPQSFAPNSAPRSAWILDARPAERPQLDGGRTVAGQQARDLVGSMARGRFLPLPAEGALDYALPERFSPSWLEVAAQGSRGDAPIAPLWLQFDDAPPRALSLSVPEALPVEEYRTSLAEAALATLRVSHRGSAGTTLDGPFARLAEPAPLLRAGTAKLSLPAGVTRIRLWREGPGETPWVALRYRAGRVFQWSEQTWRAAAAERDPSSLQADFRAALAQTPPLDEDPLRREMDSQWQVLARAIRSAGERFASAVAPPPGAPPGPQPRQFDRARVAADRGDWMGTLEALAGVGGDATHWLRVEALDALGEPYLAELQLRQAMIHGAEPRLRSEALRRLDKRYRAQQDFGALRELHSAAWLQAPDEARMLRLARALLEDGEPDLALSLALLLAPAQRPFDVVLEASLQKDWWASFDDALAHLPPDQQALWAGQRALARGDSEAASAVWRDGGAATAPWLAHLRAAQTIAARRDADGTDAALIQAQIAQWLAYHPGPRRWTADERIVAAAAGALGLYSIDRDLRFTAFRASAQQPVVLRVLGPQRIRLEARPLIAAGGAREPLQGWLRIRDGARRWLEPIINNVASEGLTLVGEPALQPGRAVSREIALGPGWHELQVDGGALPILLRAELARPALAIPLLAPPAWSDPGAHAPLPEFVARARWQGDCAGCLWLVEERADDAQAPRVHAVKLTRNLFSESATQFAEPDFARLREDFPPTYEGSGEASATRDRLIDLLWRAEQRPEAYPALLAEAEALFAGAPDIAGGAAILGRLRARSAWQRFDNIASSAGLRAIEAGQTPESPALRSRHALLAPLGEHERRLSSDSRLVLFLDRPAASRAEIHLQAETLPGLAPEPLRVALQLDQRPAQELLLLPGESHALAQAVPAGRHALRVWMVEPFANQFLRVALRGADGQPLADENERLFQVARTDAPLRASIPGPAWLRIDQWQHDGRIESRYRHVAGDWEEIELRPEAGQGEALFRLHLREVALEEAARPLPLRVASSTPVPLPPLRPEPPRHDTVVLQDGLPLGGQQDGTWSLGLERVRSLDGEESAGDGIARYDEARASYRRFEPRTDSWLLGEVLARRHRAGNPALGLRAEWYKARGEWPVNLRLRGELFAQQPRLLDLAGTHDGALAWAAHASGEIAQSREIDPMTRHRPRLSLFARHLSLRTDSLLDQPEGLALDGQPRFLALESIDRDVYTRFRADHPWGLSIGDTLTHRPWLDSEAWLSASASTNANFNLLQPDRINLGAGWRQLLGPFLGEAAIRRTHYFADNHRRQSSEASELSMELRWEHWSQGLYRHEVGVRFEQRIEDGLWGLGLFWTLHLGNGRVFEDFRASETPFRALRERRLPIAGNHFIEEETR